MPVITRYPLDPTGTSPNNLVQGEVHQLVRRQTRCIATMYGAFFANSLQVVDTTTQLPLNGDQYEAVELYELATARFGKEVCAIVLITDPAVSDEVSLTYQAVGGEFSTSATAVLELIEALQLDNRAITWQGIIDKPDGFPPAHHLHDVGDTYGWEFVVNALERVKSAIELGDRMSLDAIYRYADQVADDALAQAAATITAALNAAMAAHLAALDPHNQYLLKAEAGSLALPAVRQPVNVAPVAGALNAGSTVALTLDTYRSLYNLPQQAVRFQLSVNPGCVAPFVFDHTTNAATNTYTDPASLLGNTNYYWRGAFQDSEGTWSPWSAVTAFATGDFGIVQPSLTAPVNGSEVLTNGVTLTAAAFATSGTPDTHQSTDWEVWSGPSGTGVLLFSAYASTTSKLSIAVPPSVLPNVATYYPRVRFHGAALGASTWSADKSFNLNYPPFPTVIGELWGGGYFAGNWNDGTHTWAVIVAPKVSGEITMPLSNSTNDVGATSTIDSIGNTTKLVPGGQAATWARGLNIGGFGSWQVPALGVMQFIHENLNPYKPTAPVPFRAGGAQALETNSWYWTSSQYNWTDSGTDPPTPVYGWSNNVNGYSNVYMGWNSDVGPTPAVGCPAGQTPINVSYGYFFTSHTFPDGHTDGDTQVYASYQCQWSSYGIVSYTPGASWSIDYYDSWLLEYTAGSGAGAFQTTNAPKTSSHLVRAVRLVQIS